jgi:hypothetical protein
MTAHTYGAVTGVRRPDPLTLQADRIGPQHQFQLMFVSE